MSWMTSHLIFIGFLAALNSGLFLIASKWRIIPWYVANRKRWMPYCEFCLFFWMALIEIIIIITSGIILTFQGLIVSLMGAIVAATISRKLL